jgi:hypothetical protein
MKAIKIPFDRRDGSNVMFTSPAVFARWQGAHLPVSPSAAHDYNRPHDLCVPNQSEGLNH